MKEEFSVMEHKERDLRSELVTAQTNYAKSAAFVAEQETDFQKKISDAESAKEGVLKELDDAKALLAASEGAKGELEKKTAKVDVLEELIEELNKKGNEMSETNQDLTQRVELGEAAKAELDQVKGERDELKSNEDALKAKIDALEKEIEALREQSNEKQSSAAPAEAASPWNSSPIKPVDEEAPQNSTLDCDDTFDEDDFLPEGFLPNADEGADQTTDMQDQGADQAANTPESDDSANTPSKTPFKQKRALYSPVREEETSSKKSAKKARTPARRTTRSMKTRASRTPLGSVQNTPSAPSTTRKVRSRMSKGYYEG